MDEVEGRVATCSGVGAVGRRTFVPRETTTGIFPLCLVDVEVLIAVSVVVVHVYINVLVEVAVRSAEHQVVDEASLHELLLCQVPADGEGR